MWLQRVCFLLQFHSQNLVYEIKHIISPYLTLYAAVFERGRGEEEDDLDED